MKIAKKIYYDLATGNVIEEIGEREGSVRETSIDEDFQSYIALSERVVDTVGVIQLTYGEDREKFGLYAYHIDIETSLIAWDLTPIQIDEQITKTTLLEKIASLEVKNTNTIATVDRILTEILPSLMV